MFSPKKVEGSRRKDGMPSLLPPHAQLCVALRPQLPFGCPWEPKPQGPMAPCGGEINLIQLVSLVNLLVFLLILLVNLLIILEWVACNLITLFLYSYMWLLLLARDFFSRFLGSRNYKIQMVARVGRRSAVVLSGIVEASYSRFFIGRGFDCSLLQKL